MKKLFTVKCVIFNLILLYTLHFTHYTVFAEDETDEELKLYLGEIKLISVTNPTRIVIGNPNIADVTQVTKNEVTLSPKAVGKTTLVVWDNFGEQSYSLKVVAENIEEIKQRIDKLLAQLNLPEVYTQTEEDEGKVLLLGRVKTNQDRELISLALGPLKEKTVDLIAVKEEEAVVEIDVQVLELNKDATSTLGFTWPTSSTLTFTEKGSAGISSAGAKFSNLFKVVNLSRTTFAWTLDALVQQGKARVLSRPRLACQSGKEAELLVGGEKPIFTTTVAATTGAQGTAIEYKEFGIKLKIKPTVTEEERIKLALNVEVSEVGTAEVIGTTAAPTAKAWPLSKRTASTELFLNDEQTMAIGGLMKRKSEEDVSKTPWLGDVPLLGFFFRKKTAKVGGGTGERGDTELFITLTPKIISAKKQIVKDKPESKPQIVSPAITAGFPESIAGYASIIQERILENLSYPPLAKQAGFQGTVKLGLRLSHTGELLEAWVKDSSGYKLLDDNAISVARRISAYPPFPSFLKQKELWIDVPIVYKLD